MKIFKEIPTFDTVKQIWYSTTFSTREEFVEFLLTLFKEPGQYEFDESSFYFNEQARVFDERGFYCESPFRSADFLNYWDHEKAKCREGVIYINGDKTWYLPREYYMWLNFLPIYNKEIKKFGFAKIRDAQYHMGLYEVIAEYSYKHVAILKKRQIASSYYHAAKLINGFWFEEGFIGKMAASLKDYINDKGTWRFLDEYRNFLNEHTAWYRPTNPDRTLNWEQKIEITQDGRKKDVGLKSVLLGYALDTNPSNGVGGPCSLFFHEEAGIASKMDKTLEYLLPALKSGMGYTGMFIVAGSVGDLDHCEPLRELILNPDSKDVLKVTTNLLNSSGEYAECGLFIPEQWSMMPCIDDYGNSLVEEAVTMILEEREIWKKTLKHEDYQLRVSQKPINIEEAFAHRRASLFPTGLISKQIRRIEENEYFLEYLDLDRNEKGDVFATPSKRQPITDFPIKPSTIDKRGVLVVHERPIPNSEWGTYYGSVDPVSEGKTVSTDSLCSIYIYRNPIEVTKVKEDGSIDHSVEPDKLVAWWCGRYDDLSKTHEQLELIIEWYNAWTIVENNISLFIQYMMQRKKQKYLVPKNQILFLKELGANVNVFQEYGWKNAGTLFKGNLLSYGIQFMNEEIDHETKTDGEIVKTIYGIERIPDKMLLTEAKEYRDKLNVDRLVAYCSLIAFAKVQQANRGFSKRVDKASNSNLQKDNKNRKLVMSPFRHVGKTNSDLKNKIVRQPFRNIK